MTMHDDRMTAATVSDAAIASMFEQRARRADGGDLGASILAATASTLQVRRWRLEMPPLVSSGMQRLLVVGLIVIALAALALIGSGALRRDQIPKQTTEWFVRPFEYTIPAGSTLRPAAGGPHREVIAWVEGSDVTPDPSEELLLGDYGEQRPGSGKVHGIIVGTGEHAWSHAAERFFLRPAPAEFIADLRDIAKVEMGPVVETTLDGRPGLTTMITETPGNDIHVSGPISGLSRTYVLVNDPARLSVTEVDGETIFILIWARTLDDLTAWMPVADEFIASIHFLPEGPPS